MNKKLNLNQKVKNISKLNSHCGYCWNLCCCFIYYNFMCST